MQVSRYSIDAQLNKKFAVIADTHGRLQSDVLISIEKEQPDYIICPGDIFDRHLVESIEKHDEHIENVMFQLKTLNDFAPVIMSLGNHEFHLSDSEKENLKQVITLLDNEYKEYDNFAIGGLTSYIDCGAKASKVEKKVDHDFLTDFESLDTYKILLSHHPEYYHKYIKDKEVDLIVSGHAHGGQIRIFGKGLFSPGQGVFPKYTSGKVDRMIISRGLTNTTKVPRLFNETELIYINL